MYAKDNKEIVLVAQKLRADKEIALAAVNNNGFALESAIEELRADKEVVLAAVRENGYALRFAAKELRADKEGSFSCSTTGWMDT